MAKLARVLEVADLLAEQIGRFLKDQLPVSTVSREYVPDANDDSFDGWIDGLTPLAGFVVPLRKKSELGTRNKDNLDLSYTLVFVEKCTLAGRPTNAWMDRRVMAVDAVEEEFGDIRNPLDGSSLWAQDSEVSIIFDPDMLVVHHAFWSAVNLTLREVR